jgi:hypothetical protein
LLYWFRPAAAEKARRQTQNPTAAKANPNKFRQACHNNDAGAARNWLMLWAQQQFGRPPASLTELASWCNDATFAAELQLLNQQLYQKEKQGWQGKQLWISWSGLTLEKTQAEAVLPQLYPE